MTPRTLRARSPQTETLWIGVGYLIEVGIIASLVLAGGVLLRLVYDSIFH